MKATIFRSYIGYSGFSLFAFLFAFPVLHLRSCFPALMGFFIYLDFLRIPISETSSSFVSVL